MEHDRELDHFSEQAREECEVCSLRAERDRLRAVVDATMVSLGDDAPASPDFLPEYAGMLLREHNQLGAAHDAAVQAVTTGLAERDRLRAVVEALRFALKLIATATPEDTVERHQQVASDALDGTGVTGPGSEPDDEALAVYVRRVLARSGVEVRPCPDCGQWVFINDNGACNDPAMTDGHECDESSTEGASDG